MTRHWLAFVAATALGTAAAPSLAQDGPPEGWSDPQGPDFRAPPPMPERHRGPGPHVMPGRGDYPGAPYAPHDGYRDGPMPGYEGHGEWRGAPLPPPGAPGYDYGYGEGYAYPAAAPCGCPPPVMWMRVPVETRYHYSPPIRRVQEVVEERIVHEQVVETRTVRVPATKYVKTKYVKPAPVKMTKGKVVRSTK